MVSLDDTCVVRHQSAGDAICNALRKRALALGFEESALPAIKWSELVFSVGKDPADGRECLTGTWKDAAGYRCGQVQFNGDGSFFAEHDIALQHPTDSRWFVEAVEAWGRDTNVASDVRLLAAV